MLDDIIVATTDDSSDDRLVDYVTELGFKTYRGSRHDVLERLFLAALQVQMQLFELQLIVR